MSCIISDLALSLSASGVSSPIVGQQITATPVLIPLFQKVTATLRAFGMPARTATTDGSGAYSFTLPWPSESDPTTVQWAISIPDGFAVPGTSLVGVVPEGVAGPLTLTALKNTYGWGLVNTRSVTPVVAIQGPPGASSGMAIGGAVASGTATRTLYIDGSTNLAQSSGLTHSSASAYSLGGTPTLASNLATNGFVGPGYGGTSTNIPTNPTIAPTLLNSWVNYDSVNYVTAGYYKDSLGIVHIEGVVKNGSSGSAIIFQLPAGYRPAKIHNFVAANAALSIVSVDASGNVSAISGGSTAGQWIGPCLFLAEQ